MAEDDPTPELFKAQWEAMLDHPLRGLFYRLEGHTPVPVDDYPSEGCWARVRHTRVGPYYVSTVFLGIDHNLFRLSPGPPILFETMTFYNAAPSDPVHPGEGLDNPCDGRSCTWDEAEAIHQEAVDWVLKNACQPGDTVEELPHEREYPKND